MAVWAFRRGGDEALVRVPLEQVAGCKRTSDGVSLVTRDGRELRLFTGAIGAGGLRSAVLEALAAGRSASAAEATAPGLIDVPPRQAASRVEPSLPPLELPSDG